MERLRKPGQGVWNIVRFNWHFYVLSGGSIFVILVVKDYLPAPFPLLGIALVFLILAATLVSLLVSFYVYDLSGLYRMNWLNGLPVTAGSHIVNIHAGFDETSALLQAKFPTASLRVFDFYNPARHTEVSIRRARKAYPAFLHTRPVRTADLPLPDRYADLVLIIFSAHEIRDETERHLFFRELSRILKPGGCIVVTEHLRDLPNFLAYNLGFLHFIGVASWRRTFKQARLLVAGERQLTPFVTTFFLEKHEAST